LKRGLFGRQRTVLLMLDETILTETPPLYYGYGRIGEQIRVPITGRHAKRILHGAINITSGDVLLYATREWNQATHQEFLMLVRAHWRGWNLVLFEDRARQHTAPASEDLAYDLNIEVRYLPKATPELNAMDQLWKQMKRETLANRATESMEESVRLGCQFILGLCPRERLRKAGVLSGDFWLTI
jgi:transposase